MALLAAGAALIPLVAGDLHRNVDDLLVRRAEAVRGPAAAAGRAGGPGRIISEGRLASVGMVTRVLAGDVVVVQAGDVPEDPLPTGTPAGHSTVRVGTDSWRIYTAALPDVRPAGLRAARSARALTLQLAVPLEPIELTIATVRERARRISGLALAAAGILGFTFAQVALRPLRGLRRAAEQVASERDLGVRVPTGRGPTEIDAVARSLNAMLGKLEDSSAATASALEASRAFAANAGHELRTPFTVIQTNLEILARDAGMSAPERDRLIAEVQSQQVRLLAILDALQLLARGDLAAGLPKEPVDLADLVDSAVQNAARRWPDASITFREPAAIPGTGVVVQGWPEGLQVLVENLITNAVVHGGERDGQVTVEVTVQGGPEEVRVVVDDDGPGIPGDERQRVLGRFVRGSRAAAPGSGLGLALAAQQAGLHQGWLEILDSPLGGTRVLVTLGTSSSPTTPARG